MPANIENHLAAVAAMLAWHGHAVCLPFFVHLPDHPGRSDAREMTAGYVAPRRRHRGLDVN
jgi:hypothetical protein